MKRATKNPVFKVLLPFGGIGLLGYLVWAASSKRRKKALQPSLPTPAPPVPVAPVAPVAAASSREAQLEAARRGRTQAREGRATSREEAIRKSQERKRGIAAQDVSRLQIMLKPRAGVGVSGLLRELPKLGFGPVTLRPSIAGWYVATFTAQHYPKDRARVAAIAQRIEALEVVEAVQVSSQKQVRAS